MHRVMGSIEDRSVAEKVRKEVLDLNKRFPLKYD
jgi:glycine/serine hydroxymethyltransferase